MDDTKMKKEMGENISYGELCEKAAKENTSSIVNCNDVRFLAPSMHKEIQLAFKQRTKVPETLWQVAAVVYQSLAHCYGETIQKIENTTGKVFQQIHVIGGGSLASYLNDLTAKATGKTVYAGPVEATAIGNIAAQMIAAKELGNLQEARACIANSFELSVYKSK